MNMLAGLVVAVMVCGVSGAQVSEGAAVLWDALDARTASLGLKEAEGERLASGLAAALEDAEANGIVQSALRIEVVGAAIEEFFAHQYPQGVMATEVMKDAAAHSFGQKMHYAMVSPIYVCEDVAACERQFGVLLAEAAGLAGLGDDEARMLRMRTEPFFGNAHEPAFKRVLTDAERSVLAAQLRDIGHEHRPASEETRHSVVQEVSLALFDAFTSPLDRPAEAGVAVSGEGTAPDISADFFQTMEETAANLRALEQAMFDAMEARP